MDGDLDGEDWSGTSDGRAALRARASLTLEERLEWLDDCLNFALATGALAADRARRQAEADRWAEAAGLTSREPEEGSRR